LPQITLRKRVVSAQRFYLFKQLITNLTTLRLSDFLTAFLFFALLSFLIDSLISPVQSVTP